MATQDNKPKDDTRAEYKHKNGLYGVTATIFAANLAAVFMAKRDKKLNDNPLNELQVKAGQQMLKMIMKDFIDMFGKVDSEDFDAAEYTKYFGSEVERFVEQYSKSE